MKIELINHQIKSLLIISMFVFMMFGLHTATYSQEMILDDVIITKMDVFSSKKDAITKFINYDLPDIPIDYIKPFNNATNKIQVLISDNDSVYYYQIEIHVQKAFIEYSDLLKAINAIETLKLEEITDINTNSDYVENKFTTSEGVQIGYSVSDKGKSKWFLRLGQYGSQDMLFFASVDDIEQALKRAKDKIDELKNME